MGESSLSRTFLLVCSPAVSAISGDGRSFSFQVHRGQLLVEVYHPPRLAGPVPLEEDVVATAARSLTDFDVDDERSLTAAVRDAVAHAVPVARPSR